ncbi:MAG: FGGY family carbohydrate kinase [Armatimonadota bacterium]|nr:FGGY family carbohydrate kinase [Armatimonadota bacterium]MDR7404488.1 FGGY family carbohydrate kinase [Armatimonadota bacterium]
MRDAVLTLDLGTTACKATWFDLDGRPLAAASAEYPTRHPRPGWAEQDPEEWWTAAVAAARRAREAAGAVRTVAVGLSSQREGVVPVDDRGTPLGPCIIWMDRRATAEARVLAERFGDELRERTGLRADPTFTACRLLWLRRHQPELYSRTRYFLQPRDFLYHRLTGTPVTDPSLASRTLLFDIRRLTWWPEMAEAVGVDLSRFPPLYPSSSAPGALQPPAASALGLTPGTPVAVGAGDRACEALGLGLAGETAMVSTGTTTNVSVAVPQVPEVLGPGVLCSAHCLPGQYLLEQGLGASGAILRWLRDRILAGRLDYPALDALAQDSPPGARGLLLLPFFAGARAPRWNPAARGVWFGLTLSHDLGDLVRSVLEGVAYEVRACLEELHRIGVAVTTLVSAGGAARSALWREITADVTARPVAVPVQTEAASLGAMLLAAAAVGAAADPLAAAQQANPAVVTVRPQASRAARYERSYRLYAAVYAAVAPLFPPVDQDEDADAGSR